METNNIFLNRELSWLQFNARVLQEAADIENPLISRLRFLGIYSNNLDEFFRVRVATVSRLIRMNGTGEMKEKYPNPKKVLRAIIETEKEQQKEFGQIFKALMQELRQHGVCIITHKELDEIQGKYVREYFRENVRSRIFPILLSNMKETAIHDHLLYLAVIMQQQGKPSAERYALVEVPTESVSRFIKLPSADGKHYIILLDDVIRYCLDEIFAPFGFDTYKAFAIKFTRDAELDIDNDVSKSFLELMAESLRQREIGSTVRFVYDKNIPDRVLKILLNKLNITKADTISPGGRYHNHKDFMKFPDLNVPNAEFPPLPPLQHPLLKTNSSILGVIKERDSLLHYPYQSFNYFIDLLREASLDPAVRAIKMTLYRVANNSAVVNALINAARNGKSVTVFLEFQARFDEEMNIFWAEKMQLEGVKIIQSIPGYKVHAKLLLIRRKENEKNVYYAGVGTGNFNETTAKVYTDLMLLTADKDIVNDVNNVFHVFETIYNMPKFQKLVVAPFQMRSHFIKLINNEIKAAKEGRDAWIILKMNSLEDIKIVKKLYEAGRAGVKVKLLIRGICVLKPGVAGLSENIEARSVVGRFLEHSRVMVFANAGNPLYYLSSADWMERNFDNRIEVACPVEDKELQKEILTMLQIQLLDNTNARYINSVPENIYYEGNPNLKTDSQLETYRFFKDKIL